MSEVILKRLLLILLAAGLCGCAPKVPEPVVTEKSWDALTAMDLPARVRTIAYVYEIKAPNEATPRVVRKDLDKLHPMDLGSWKVEVPEQTVARLRQDGPGVVVVYVHPLNCTNIIAGATPCGMNLARNTDTGETACWIKGDPGAAPLTINIPCPAILQFQQN
jgi:hypothetical protein